MNTKHIQLNWIKQQGFTFIESMVVASIFVFGFVAANKVQVNMIKGKQAATQGGEAVQVSAQEVERLRNFSNLTDYGAIANSSGSLNAANTTYTDALTVTTQTRYKRLDQTLTWTDANSGAQTISMASYINGADPKYSGLLFSTAYNDTPLPSPGAGASTSETSDPPASPEATSSPSTTDVTIPGTDIVVTYDQNNQVTAINHGDAVTLSGAVTVGTAADAPTNSVTLSEVTVTPTSTNNIVNTCSYSGSTGVISCIMGSTWSGSILLGGVTSVKVCVTTEQPYTNLLTSLTGQNYILIKTTRSCPSTHPHLLQTL